MQASRGQCRQAQWRPAHAIKALAPAQCVCAFSLKIKKLAHTQWRWPVCKKRPASGSIRIPVARRQDNRAKVFLIASKKLRLDDRRLGRWFCARPRSGPSAIGGSGRSARDLEVRSSASPWLSGRWQASARRPGVAQRTAVVQPGAGARCNMRPPCACVARLHLADWLPTDNW